MSIISIQEEFNSRLSLLNREEILEMNLSIFNTPLNNVVEGFERFFIGISFGELENIEEYHIVFISHFDVLKGMSLRSGKEVINRDFLTLEFAKNIELRNPVNALIIFNSFQQQLKEIYERSGIVCVPYYSIKNDYSLDMFMFNSVDAVNKRSAGYLLQIDILNLYRSYFPSHTGVKDVKGVQKIYLFYDNKDNMVKIGETKDYLLKRRKSASEATKRAKDPMIDILVAWIAPKVEEDNLHKKYREKIERGEWFDLRTTDIEHISKYMKQYKVIDPQKYNSSTKDFLL
jgi:hypothetical protein